MKDKRNGFVYFISNSDRTAIKCGWSSNIMRRIKQFETANPLDLKLIYYIEGTMDIEYNIKKYLKDYCINREWFEYEGTMRYINQYKLNHIEQLKEGIIEN